MRAKISSGLVSTAPVIQPCRGAALPKPTAKPNPVQSRSHPRQPAMMGQCCAPATATPPRSLTRTGGHGGTPAQTNRGRSGTPGTNGAPTDHGPCRGAALPKPTANPNPVPSRSRPRQSAMMEQCCAPATATPHRSLTRTGGHGGTPARTNRGRSGTPGTNGAPTDHGPCRGAALPKPTAKPNLVPSRSRPRQSAMIGQCCAPATATPHRSLPPGRARWDTGPHE
jgi:hypothetical protein